MFQTVLLRHQVLIINRMLDSDAGPFFHPNGMPLLLGARGLVKCTVCMTKTCRRHSWSTVVNGRMFWLLVVSQPHHLNAGCTAAWALVPKE